MNQPFIMRRINKPEGGFRTIYILKDNELLAQSKRVAKMFNAINKKNWYCATSIPDIINKITHFNTTNDLVYEVPQEIRNQTENANEILKTVGLDLEFPIEEMSSYRIYESDIKDCFHSIDLNKFPKRKEVILEILNYMDISLQACFIKTDKKLLIPQGYPSSPALVNFILGNIDKRITSLLNLFIFKISYLRYVDNLFIIFYEYVNPDKINHILNEISYIIHSSGLKLKHAFKIRQDILGVSINGQISPRAILKIFSSKKNYNDHVKNGIKGYLYQFDEFKREKIYNQIFKFFDTTGGINFGQNI